MKITSKDGDGTTSLGHLFQHLTSHDENIFCMSGSAFPLTHIGARMEIKSELGEQLGLYNLLNM